MKADKCKQPESSNAGRFCPHCLKSFEPRYRSDQIYCSKSCRRSAIDARYRAAHQESIIKRNAEYYEKNHDTLRELDKRRKKQNAERIKEQGRLYRQANADKIREYRRRTYLDNRERMLEKAAARRSADPEAHREGLKRWRKSEKGKAWRIANRDRINLDSHVRRARLASNGGKFTAGEWESLKARYCYKCLACGKGEPEIKLTPDHIVPVSKGGPNVAENIQPLCGPCNSSKKDRTIDYRPRDESALCIA